MDIKFSSTKEEFLYYEELVSLYPERIYVSYYTKHNEGTKLKYKYLGYSIDNMHSKYNVNFNEEIICADSFSNSSGEKYLRKSKKKNNMNKIKIVTLSSLFVVSAVLANNYLSDK